MFSGGIEKDHWHKTIIKIIKKTLALESHSSKSQGREIQSPLPLKIKAVSLQLY